MAIEFNVTALDRFRNVEFGNNENTTAHITYSGDVEAGKVYGGKFSAIGRSREEEKANNQVRTELLKTLGNLFGLEGMTEANGKVTFSKAFMDKLEQMIGKDFKREDFGIKNGVVASGRPLTQRRINAILDKAEILGVQAKKTGEVKGITSAP
ncbi:MAG: hypothetical protein IJS08_09170 [Victivallales bacterium]|nr:hypothetical protein [Victivallales bacterium]